MFLIDTDLVDLPAPASENAKREKARRGSPCYSGDWSLRGMCNGFVSAVLCYPTQEVILILKKAGGTVSDDCCVQFAHGEQSYLG